MNQVNKKKILVADDEENIRLLARRMLDKHYIVLTASNGQEAIDIARSQTPDFILMDIMMPEMDGYAACSVIKTDPATAVIPVVMLTVLGHAINKKFAEEMGASGYITKPFSSQDLLGTIGQFLESSE